MARRFSLIGSGSPSSRRRSSAASRWSNDSSQWSRSDCVGASFSCSSARVAGSADSACSRARVYWATASWCEATRPPRRPPQCRDAAPCSCRPAPAAWCARSDVRPSCSSIAGRRAMELATTRRGYGVLDDAARQLVPEPIGRALGEQRPGRRRHSSIACAGTPAHGRQHVHGPRPHEHRRGLRAGAARRPRAASGAPRPRRPPSGDLVRTRRRASRRRRTGSRR